MTLRDCHTLSHIKLPILYRIAPDVCGRLNLTSLLSKLWRVSLKLTLESTDGNEIKVVRCDVNAIIVRPWDSVAHFDVHTSGKLKIS
jgi:hypothetical protein